MKRLFTKGIIAILIFGFINQPLMTQRVYAEGIPTWDISQFIKEYGLDAVAKVFLQRFLDKITQSTIAWAEGGFDGEPSFISNWDDFIKDMKTDALRLGLDYALYRAQTSLGSLASSLGEQRKKCEEEIRDKYQFSYINESEEEEDLSFANEQDIEKEIRKKCGTIAVEGGTANALAQAAHDNWRRYHEGGGLDARYTALTLAKYASKELNVDELKSEIDRERPLNKLLGRAGYEKYKDDFSAGGWLAYIAQSGDNPLVNNSRLVSKAKAKFEKKVKRGLDQMFVSNKHLDKKKCPKGTDENGKCKGEGDLKTKGTENENKSQITTDKETVNKKSLKNLLRGEEEAIAADEFTEIIAHAVGDLTFGLLEVGARNLILKAGRKRNGNAFYRELGTFAANQDDYDVLGIMTDTNLLKSGKDGKNIKNSGKSVPTSEDGIYHVMAGDDASIRYIGGPEDVKSGDYSLTNGPEVIVNLQEVLDKNLKLSKAYLDELTKARVILNRSISYSSYLDHCLPGPDLGWEERYKDKVRWVRTEKFDYPNKEKKQKKCDSIHAVADQWEGEGFSLTKEMSEDDFLNIPGAAQLRSMVQSLTGGSVSKAFDGVSADISEKRKVYVALLTVKENLLERMRKIQQQLGIPVDLPLFEEQVQEQVLKDDLKQRLDRTIVSFKQQTSKITLPDQENGAPPPAIDRDASDDDRSSPILEDLDSFTPKDFLKKDDFAKFQSLPADNQELIKLPNLSGYHFTSTRWKISDADLIRILKLPASLVDKEAKPGELLVENLGLYIFKNYSSDGKKVSGESSTAVRNGGGEVSGIVSEKKVSNEKGEERETPESLVRSNKKKAVKLAMDLAWALWRKFTPREEKARARYQYHLLKTRGKLITERDYLDAQLNTKNLSATARKAVDYAQDCLTFVEMASRTRFDKKINSILEREYEKQKNKGESMFVTDLFTSPAHRKTSILKFSNTSVPNNHYNGPRFSIRRGALNQDRGYDDPHPGENPEVEKYYRDMYPGARDYARAYDITTILRKDRTLRTLKGISPKSLSFDRSAIIWGAVLPVTAVGQLFGASPAVSLVDNPNLGKILFCNAAGPEYKDACWKGHRVDICVTDGPTAGQTWYYSPRSVYRAAVANITSSSY